MTAATNDQVIHGLQNHLAVSVGFCDLLVSDTAAGSTHRRSACGAPGRSTGDGGGSGNRQTASPVTVEGER